MLYIPEWCFDAVVTLGVPQNPDQPRWCGTGVLFRHHVHAGGADQPAHYLITAKHVAEQYPSVYALFPNGHGVLLTFSLGGVAQWRSPANHGVDIAVLPMPPSSYQHIAQEFDSSSHIAGTQWMVDNNAREGVECFAIGPQVGSAEEQVAQVHPTMKLAKRATIAHIRGALANVSQPIKFDGFVWNGWSGAPVMILQHGEGGNPPIPRLVGIIGSYTPFPDRLASPTTGAQLTLQYNSGLFSGYLIDNALEAIDQ